jgi:hypothetical protein
MRKNPEATREEIANAVGCSLHRVQGVISYDKNRLIKKRKVVVQKNTKSAGIRLMGGYYTLEKLKEIVNALETLNKLMAKEANE